MPLSLKRIFEPAPIIVILRLLVKLSFKNSINSDLLFGLKRYSANPPRLNQL